MVILADHDVYLSKKIIRWRTRKRILLRHGQNFLFMETSHRALVLGRMALFLSDGTQTTDKNSCESNIVKRLLIIRAD
jgi:hypothetical protein